MPEVITDTMVMMVVMQSVLREGTGLEVGQPVPSNAKDINRENKLKMKKHHRPT